MSISSVSVSSSSYRRLESPQSEAHRSNSGRSSELDSSRDLPVGVDQRQFDDNNDGPRLPLNGSNVLEELSAAGIEDFNIRLINTDSGSSSTITVPVTALNSNIEAQQLTGSVTAEAAPTASAEELLDIDTILSNPDVVSMMAAQTFDISAPTTPAQVALFERYGEQRYAQMQRYDTVMTDVREHYQNALAAARRGNGSGGGGRNDSVSYTTGRYWDVTHGLGKNGTTTSTFNISRFRSDYLQRDTASARLYATVQGSFSVTTYESPKTGEIGRTQTTFNNSEFALLDLDNLPRLHDQDAISMVEGLGWVTAKDNVVRDSGGGILGGLGNIFSEVGGFLSDTVQGVGNVLNDGLDFINEEIVSPVISAIPVIGEPINDRIVQPIFGLGELAINLGTNTIDFVIDTSTNLGVGVTDVLSHLAAGDIPGALSSAGQTIATFGGDVAGFAVESGAFVLKTAALTFNALFSSSETRGLLPAERDYLETIYGDSLDYNDIEIQIGGTLESALDLRAHAIGNTIYMPESNFQGGVLTERGLDLLAHEAAHVWQFQNDGANYIEEAVFSYFDDALDGSNDAYDFTTAIRDLTPWNEMTPDHQAEIAMVIGEALEQNPAGVLTIKDLSNAIRRHNSVGPSLGVISQSQFVYLEDIQQLLLNGEV